MPRPARPPPDLIVIQAHFACGRFEAALNRPSSPGHRTTSSRYVRGRLGGMAIWRLQGPRCRAGLTVLPHVVLRDRQRPPAVAREALLAPHGAAVGRGGPSAARSPRWRSSASAGRSDTRVWWPCSPGVSGRGRPMSWPMNSPVTASHVTHSAGVATRERGRRWCQDQQAGWSGCVTTRRCP